MKLYDIGENEQIQIVARSESASWEYETSVVMNQKNILFIEPIMHDGLIVNFQVDQVQTDVVYVSEEGKPLIWENCLMKSVTFNGKKYHILYSDKEGKTVKQTRNLPPVYWNRGTLQIEKTRATKA